MNHDRLVRLGFYSLLLVGFASMLLWKEELSSITGSYSRMVSWMERLMDKLALDVLKDLFLSVERDRGWLLYYGWLGSTGSCIRKDTFLVWTWRSFGDFILVSCELRKVLISFCNSVVFYIYGIFLLGLGYVEIVFVPYLDRFCWCDGLLPWVISEVHNGHDLVALIKCVWVTHDCSLGPADDLVLHNRWLEHNRLFFGFPLEGLLFFMVLQVNLEFFPHNLSP